MNKDNIKKIKNKKIKIILIILIILAIIVLSALIILKYLMSENEDVEAKIMGSMYSVNWSEETEVSNKSLDEFEKKLNENLTQYKKNIVIMHQYNGCTSCLEDILNELKNKQYEKSNLNVMLVTTMHKDDIESVYGNEMKNLDIFSDFEYQIGKKLKVFNELDMENEDVILYIEDGKLENAEEYYFKESNEVSEYIDSKI